MDVRLMLPTEQMHALGNGDMVSCSWDFSKISIDDYNGFFSTLPNILYKKVRHARFCVDYEKSLAHNPSATDEDVRVLDYSIKQKKPRFSWMLAKVIARTLPRSKLLTSLTISGIPMRHSDVQAMFKAIPKCRTLKAIVVEDMPIRNEDFEYLLSVISPYRMTEVSFVNCGLSSEIYQPLVRFLKKEPPTELHDWTFKKLRLDGNDIGAREFSVIDGILRQKTDPQEDDDIPTFTVEQDTTSGARKAEKDMSSSSEREVRSRDASVSGGSSTGELLLIEEEEEEEESLGEEKEGRLEPVKDALSEGSNSDEVQGLLKIDDSENSKHSSGSEHSKKSKHSDYSDHSKHSDDSEHSKHSRKSKQSKQSKHSDDSEHSHHSDDSEHSKHSRKSKQSKKSRHSDDSEHSKHSDDSEHSKYSRKSKQSKKSRHSDDSEHSHHSDDSEHSKYSRKSKQSKQSRHSDDSEHSKYSKKSKQSHHSDDSEHSKYSKKSKQSKQSRRSDDSEHSHHSDHSDRDSEHSLHSHTSYASTRSQMSQHSRSSHGKLHTSKSDVQVSAETMSSMLQLQDVDKIDNRSREILDGVIARVAEVEHSEPVSDPWEENRNLKRELRELIATIKAIEFEEDVYIFGPNAEANVKLIREVMARLEEYHIESARA